MFLALLTMVTALAISAVAIYYSVAGLAAIFAAAVLPIIIMGGVLEIAKLVTAVWLHRYWDRAVWWLRSYLAIAVFVLMLITSMGIFGFLSKAHIEQTSMSTEQVAQIQNLEENLARSQSKVTRWNEELDRLLSGGSGFRVDNLLASNQQELDSLYERINTEKSAEREQARDQIEQQNNRLEQAANRKTQDLEAAVDARDQALQQAERYNTGGIINNQTELYNDAVERANDTYDTRVKEIESQELSVASSAQREIRNINALLADTLSDIDNRYEDQIDQLVNRINDLRNETNNKTDDVDTRIAELENFVEQEQNQMGLLREEKAVLETQYRMLEAEVGPVKYIAEFVYGEQADQDLLEKAVRWVIITIIFVFDPLAVLLLIASQYTFRFRKEDNDRNQSNITDNNAEPDDSTTSNRSTNDQSSSENITEGRNPADDSVHLQQVGTTGLDSSSQQVDQPSAVDDAAMAIAESYMQSAETKKKELLNYSEPLTEEERKEAYELADNTASWTEAKSAWKQDHPNETLKEYKKKYIRGQIDTLPWESYVQNGEQTKSSLWQKLKDAQNNTDNTSR